MLLRCVPVHHVQRTHDAVRRDVWIRLRCITGMMRAYLDGLPIFSGQTSRLLIRMPGRSKNKFGEEWDFKNEIRKSRPSSFLARGAITFSKRTKT